MRRFSDDVMEAEKREFEVLGEVFRWRYPGWDEFSDRLDADFASVRSTNGDATEAGEKPNEHATREMYQDYVDRIAEFIDPDWNDGVTRWKALAAPKRGKKIPVPAYLLMDIWNYLVEVTTRSPTKLPSASAAGQPSTEPTSPGDSS